MAAGADVASAGSGDEGSDEGAKPKKKQPPKKGTIPRKELQIPIGILMKSVRLSFLLFGNSMVARTKRQRPLGIPLLQRRTCWVSCRFQS